MKKVLSKIGDFFSRILSCIIAILIGICFVIMLPLDYIKYKRSPYYRTEHKKYKLFAGTGIYFELYNEIIKNDLPIKYIYNPNNDSLECGWFIFNDTLIVPNVFSFEYNAESSNWNYCCDVVDDEENEKRIIMSLDEYMKTEIQEANEFAENVICSKAIVLIDANCIENVEFAKQENCFLVYDNNREDVLKTFCKNSIR